MQWVIVADAGGARFFEHDEDGHELIEKLNLVHPEARLRASEVYEAPPSTSRDDVEDARFARTVAAEARSHSRSFDRLQIAAPPSFLGHLRKALDKSVARKLGATLAKDLTHLSVHELKKVLGV